MPAPPSNKKNCGGKSLYFNFKDCNENEITKKKEKIKLDEQVKKKKEILIFRVTLFEIQNENVSVKIVWKTDVL